MHYHSIQSENILIWTLDPLVVRLSDGGVMQKSHKCGVCCTSCCHAHVARVLCIGMQCTERIS